MAVRAPGSAADTAHRAGGLHEVGLADVVAGFLLPHNPAQPIRDGRIVVAAIAQSRAQVVLGHAEKARANLAVGGEAKTVAMSAKGFAHRRDDADLSAAIRNAKGELIIPTLVSGTLAKPRLIPDAPAIAKLKLQNAVPGILDAVKSGKAPGLGDVLDILGGGGGRKK